MDSIELTIDDDTGTFEGEAVRTTPQYISRIEFSTAGLGPVAIYDTPRLPDLDEVLRFSHNQFEYPSRGRQGVNMLVNPGFEQAFSGWSRGGNAAIRRADPAPFNGAAYVYGSATPSFTVSQDVALRAWASPDEIDAGGLTAVFGGWQAGWETQTDFGVITIMYLNGTGAQLGSKSLAPFYSNHRWVEQTGSSTVPPGTRTLRFRFVGTRKSGSNDDAYLDAAYVCLDGGAGSSAGGARCQPNEAL